jgi:hypothetical protein
VLDRAHGKAAPVIETHRDPDFVPLAERLKFYAQQEAIEAADAEGKVQTCRRRNEHYRPRPTRLYRP